jgi:hypothetical protein
MSTHLLTPAMAGLLERMQRAQRTPFHALSVADARPSSVSRCGGGRLGGHARAGRRCGRRGARLRDLAECHPLVDDGLAYADKLRAAGVAVELELYRGLTHDFIKMGRTLKEASLALDVASHALKKAWST